MNHTPDATATAGNGGNFDPQQAAALLDQTTQQARRKFEPYPPWLYVVRAVAILGIFGAVWLSVRGQHPYQHPTSAVIPFVIIFAVLNLTAVVTVARRATAGVSGKTKLRPVEIAVIAVIWIGVFVIMGVLAGAGVSNSVVYGLYPATVPLIAAGLAWAGIAAARGNRRACGSSLATAIVGAVALSAGPAGAWAVAGVGLCLTLLGNAVVVARRQHA
jgi:hypothetical protein